MTAYYNENDFAAAHVLRCLIEDGIIAPGIVDDRSIKEVTANDLRGFTQAHFFAGAGTWSVAARLAGWSDAKPLWTASCPCQPFSAAGKGAGTDDPRHLWPDLFRILRDARAQGFGPDFLVGEQVAGKAGYGWFDGVRTDLAQEGYACGVRDFPALAVDAPHERNRLYWCAVDDAKRVGSCQSTEQIRAGRVAVDLANADMADAQRSECDGRSEQPGRGSEGRVVAGGDDAGGEAVEYAAGKRRGEGKPEPEFRSGRTAVASTDAQGDMGNTGSERRSETLGSASNGTEADWEGATDRFERICFPDDAHRNGSFWADAQWIECHDGKARRTKPGLCLLVNGLAGRIHLWRLAGNSIVAEQAAEVLRALLEAEAMTRAA